MLIAIEGTDGCGKATQSKLLQEWFEKHNKPCKRISFPNYDSISCGPVKMYLNGDFGSAYSLDPYQINSMFAVDRLCTMQTEKDYIEKGGNIIFDRYVQTSMIHQTATLNSIEEKEKFLDYVDKFEFGTLKLPRPDKVVFLHLPFETSMELAKSRPEFKSGLKKDIHEQDEKYMKASYDNSLYVAKKFGWTVIECAPNGTLLSREEIHEKILTELGL